jgi:hypothetical protein
VVFTRHAGEFHVRVSDIYGSTCRCRCGDCLHPKPDVLDGAFHFGKVALAASNSTQLKDLVDGVDALATNVLCGNTNASKYIQEMKFELETLPIYQKVIYNGPLPSFLIFVCESPALITVSLHSVLLIPLE